MLKKISLVKILLIFFGFTYLAHGEEPKWKNSRDGSCEPNSLKCKKNNLYLSGYDLINKTNFTLNWRLGTEKHGTLDGEVLSNETSSIVERSDVKSKKLIISVGGVGLDIERQFPKEDLEIDLTDHEGVIKKYCGWDKAAVIRFKPFVRYWLGASGEDPILGTWNYSYSPKLKVYPGWYCFFEVSVNDKNKLVFSGYDLRDGNGNDWYKIFDKQSLLTKY